MLDRLLIVACLMGSSLLIGLLLFCWMLTRWLAYDCLAVGLLLACMMGCSLFVFVNARWFLFVCLFVTLN
jgi:hypothetical protein